MVFENLAGANLQTLLSNPWVIVSMIIFIAWKVAWYGLALWDCIEKKKKTAFIIFLVLMVVVNDFGAIPIIYLTIINDKKPKITKKKK